MEHIKQMNELENLLGCKHIGLCFMYSIKHVKDSKGCIKVCPSGIAYATAI